MGQREGRRAKIGKCIKEPEGGGNRAKMKIERGKQKEQSSKRATRREIYRQKIESNKYREGKRKELT